MQTTQEIQGQLDALLQTHRAALDTRAVVLSTGVIAKAWETLRQHLPEGPWLLGADQRTWEVCGKALARGFPDSQLWEVQLLEDHPDHGHPLCDNATISTISGLLERSDYVAVVAIGSGTVNDIFKFASFEHRLPCASVATAPSMNGYTSKIAAILSHGVKTTQPCHAPRVVLADLEVLASAPARMIASGLGDLVSKPVSNADWQLAASLTGSTHSAEAMAVIEQGARMLEGVAPRLQHHDLDAMAGLTGSLIVSGLAMSIAGSSSPASGGEHLISHFIDMTAHAFDEPYDFHGCQVGVGTLTTALFYEKLQALAPDQIDIDALVEAHLPWEQYDQVLRERFGTLYTAVVKHAKPGYPTKLALRTRLVRLVKGWDEIMAKVGQTLRPCKAIEHELLAAEAPVRFAQLRVSQARARRAIVHSKDIRNRYTILHLAGELGRLESWADEALEVLFE